MANPSRKIAFILASTDHGSMIVNRFDFHSTGTNTYGVGFSLLENSAYDPSEINTVIQLLSLRHQHFGDGVVAIDCGANIGVHTVEWGKAMTRWGSVIAIEAQERVYYALAGNVAINNCFNVTAINAAVDAGEGVIRIPKPNYQVPGSFGSLELKGSATNEFIGQVIDYADDAMAEVRAITIDSFSLKRLDLIKIDVEGMELAVFEGARKTLATHHPVIWVEHIKTDIARLQAALESHGYALFNAGNNILAVHPDDPTINSVRQG